MPKPNKPRTFPTPDPETVKSLLAKHEINPSEVAQAIHFSDGSLCIVMQRGEDLWHLGFEFSNDLTSEIAVALRSVGVPVERRDE
jgi:hypothetical protein